MEVRGLVLLRIADPQFGKIRLAVENNDNKGFQMQVRGLNGLSLVTHPLLRVPYLPVYSACPCITRIPIFKEIL